jgi:hypothetical protein
MLKPMIPRAPSPMPEDWVPDVNMPRMSKLAIYIEKARSDWEAKTSAYSVRLACNDNRIRYKANHTPPVGTSAESIMDEDWGRYRHGNVSWWGVCEFTPYDESPFRANAQTNCYCSEPSLPTVEGPPVKVKRCIGVPTFETVGNTLLKRSQVHTFEYPTRRSADCVLNSRQTFTATFIDGHLTDKIGLRNVSGTYLTMANLIKFAGKAGHAVAGLLDVEWYTNEAYNNRHWNIMKSIKYEKEVDVPMMVVHVTMEPSGRTVSTRRRKNMSSGTAEFKEDIWIATIVNKQWGPSQGFINGGFNWKENRETFEFSMTLVNDMLTAAGAPSASLKDMKELESRFSRLGAGASHISSDGSNFLFQNSTQIALLKCANRTNESVLSALTSDFQMGRQKH